VAAIHEMSMQVEIEAELYSACRSTGILDQCGCRGCLELASSNDRLIEPFQAEIPVAAI
jgi:hypothetical protein